jgi:hypothetical protein
MTDGRDGKTDMRPQKPLKLNPEALEKIAPAYREAVQRVETVVERAPWHKRLVEGVLHHLAGELAGILIGLILGYFISWGQKGPSPQTFANICIVPSAAPPGDGQKTFRLVPCPPADHTIQAPPDSDRIGLIRTRWP